MTYPKFIIEIGDDGEKQLVLGLVEYHRQLANDRTKVLGGGWFQLDEEKNRVILSGESEEFGSARLVDIIECVNDERVFGSKVFHELEYYYRHEDGELVKVS